MLIFANLNHANLIPDGSKFVSRRRPRGESEFANVAKRRPPRLGGRGGGGLSSPLTYRSKLAVLAVLAEYLTSGAQLPAAWARADSCD